MCEISIIDPSANSIDRLVDVTKAMFKRNNDGVGLVGVYPEGDQFRYTSFKSTEFDKNSVAGFFGGNQDAWRVIAHCRLATHGDVVDDNVHPLEIEDERCDANMVVHNGVVTGYQSWRQSLEAEGHDFNTDVDSEVIAHHLNDIPESIEDLDEEDFGLTGSLNFLLLGDERILVRSGYKYQDRPESFLMGLPVRCAWDGDKARQWMLVHPDKEVETMMAGTQNRWSGRRSGVGSSYYDYLPDNGTSQRNSQNTEGDSGEDEEEVDHVVELQDDDFDDEDLDEQMENVRWEEDWLHRYTDEEESDVELEETG